MDDRTLLEMAAKAAGIDVRWHQVWQCFVHEGPFNITTPATMSGQRMVWIPLDDDGDALRLAVKLQLTVCNEHVSAGVAYCTDTDENIYPEIRSAVEMAGAAVVAADYAATRIAIVRAAAAIGAALP